MGNTLNRKARKEAQNEHLRQMFLDASAGGDCMSVAHLLESGVQPDAPDAKARTEVKNNRVAFLQGLDSSSSALCSVFADSPMYDPNVLRMLVDMGCPWPRERTPLHVAAAADQVEVVKLLIEKGARLEAKDEEGFTAMTLACRERHVRTMAALIDAGADVNTQCDQGSTALMWASWNGHTDVVEQLLDAGAEPDLQNKYGQTSLMFAAFDNQLEVVEILTSRGADPALWNEDGQTALMSASHEGHAEVVEALLHCGRHCAVNHQDINGRTALMFGAWKGHSRLVQALLYCRATGDIQDTDGRTALMMTAWKGHADIVEMLVEGPMPVHPDITDKDNQTALIWAAAACRLECLELLLKARADPLVKDNDGRTALFCSESRQHTAAVALFKKYSSPRTNIPRGLSHYALDEVADTSSTSKFMPPAVERVSAQQRTGNHVELVSA